MTKDHPRRAAYVAAAVLALSVAVSAPPAAAVQWDNVAGNCAWVADDGCSYVTATGQTRAFVVSPTQPSVSGAYFVSEWDQTPIPGAGTSLWSGSIAATSGATVTVSAAPNTSGVVVWNSIPPVYPIVPVGAGVVTGDLVASPGIPLGPTCAVSGIDMSLTTTGLLSTSEAHAVGSLDIGLSGGSTNSGECAANGAGSLTVTSCGGEAREIVPNPNGLDMLSCTGGGTYQRVGSTVVLSLAVTITFSYSSNSSKDASVIVSGTFVPTAVAPCAAAVECVVAGAYSGSYAYL